MQSRITVNTRYPDLVGSYDRAETRQAYSQQCNTLLQSVTLASSMSVLRKRMQTHLFSRSFENPSTARAQLWTL